jgi:ribosomal protein S6E (S10)
MTVVVKRHVAAGGFGEVARWVDRRRSGFDPNLDGMRKRKVVKLR